ncbi:MAG: GNAT family N-acetyltransferase [bacterium]|nr:GNAT family N-acetyltransferase [bacterium]
MRSTITVRPYVLASDYEAVNRFFVDVYQHDEVPVSWLQPRWEYMHAHPFIDTVPLERIAVFEDGGQIVGVAHPEDNLAFVYFQRRPEYGDILPAMFDHADRVFGGPSTMLQRDVIGVFIAGGDQSLEDEATSRGYQPLTGHHEGYSEYPLDQAVPAVSVPDGFRIHSLADDNDHRKINLCLWRGFNHEGTMAEEEAEQPGVAQGAPNFRKDLTIVAVAPNGEYVSYAGMWHETINRYGYVEPVATDPDYRRRGLGRAVVFEALRRVRADGAKMAWVGSDQEFYKAIGFEKRFQRNLWVKYLD